MTTSIPHLHAVQFYESEEFLHRTAGDFLADGAIAGERLVVIATPEHRRAFSDHLSAKGFDSGAIHFADAREMLSSFFDGGVIDERRFAAIVGGAISDATNGHGRVRAFGEMVDLLWRDGYPDGALRLEELWNELATHRDFALLCAYSIGSFYKTTDAQLFEEICRRHDHVRPAESFDGGADDDARAREIARLQQRAEALKTAEEANAKLYQRAQEANHAKDEFLATLSHELRTPLTAISGWARLLLMGGLDDQTTRVAVETIDRSARTQAALIDDLLDLSRIVTGKLTLERDLVDLGTIAESAAQTQRLAAEAKSIQLDVELPHDRMVVMGDGTRLQQVVWNLITNAIKFSAQGTIVSVTVDREANNARIRVRDNGRGIKPEFLPHVFEPFCQAESTTTRAFSGLGLGLAIVKYLVESHGGTVGAQSDGEGTGATFDVRLPIAARRALAADEVITPKAVDLSGISVLLVDDDADTRERARAILRRCGAEVQTAESVDQACTALESANVDVVVTDIAMPSRDGFALLEHVRSHDALLKVRVVALTASAQKAEHEGFNAYLQKPVDPLRFANVIAGLR